MEQVLPHDDLLERELVGALVSHSHVGPKPDPADFYDLALSRVARAVIDHDDRLTFKETATLMRDEPVFSLVFEGLAEVLAELGDQHPRRTAFYAGTLASHAPVTHEGDVTKLHRLATARRRLIALEEERRALLQEPAR